MSLRPPPAFQFYPRDWLSSSAVRRMTYTERGIFLELLLFSWCDGGIPDDDVEIAKLLHITVGAWRKCAPRIRPRFIPQGDGLLVNVRLEQVRAEQEAHARERSEAGKAGAKKRWQKHPVANGSDIAQPSVKNGTAIQQPLAKYSSSSSSSSAVRTVRTGGVYRETSAEPTADTPPPPLVGPRLCPLSASHAWCDGKCHVPRAIHVEFQRLAPETFNLLTWYAEVDQAFTHQTVGDDMFDFWRARWRERWGTTRKTDQVLREAEQQSEQSAALKKWATGEPGEPT